MYDRVLVISINSYYSKVPSTGTAVLLRSTVPTTANNRFPLYTNIKIRGQRGRVVKAPCL